MTHLSVGQQLAHARSERGLSLEQAAHFTKIRPDKLAALEADDFSAFPNNTYGRGFLVIYGKFLSIDVSELAGKLESSNPISVQDYQYLSGPPDIGEPEARARSRPREKTRSRRPSLAPLIVFIILVILAAFGINFYLSTQRLGDLDRANRASAADDTAASAGSPIPPLATESSPEPLPPDSEPVPAEIGSPSASTTPATTDTSPPPPPPIPQIAAPGPNELAVEPIKQSWVRIRRDDPASEPVFEDFLYPGVGPLKIKGTRFFLEMRDGGSVQVRKNGQPLVYQAPGIVVQ